MKSNYILNFVSLTCSCRKNDSIDSGLTPEGLDKIQNNYLRLKDSFDFIISSSSKSCAETLKTLDVSFSQETRLIKPINFSVEDHKSNLYHETYRECWIRVCSYLFELAYRQAVQPNKKYLLCLEPEVVNILRAIEYKTKKEYLPYLKSNYYTTNNHEFTLSDLDYLLNI